MPVTFGLRTLALAGLFMVMGAGAGIAGGTFGWGEQSPAHLERLSLVLRGCAFDDDRPLIDVRYVDPAEKLSHCGFRFNFIPRNGPEDWHLVPVGLTLVHA